MVRIRIFQLIHDLGHRHVCWHLGLLVFGHDFFVERYDDYVWVPHGSYKPENRENQLVSVYFRQHLRRLPMGRAICVLHRRSHLK